MMRSRECFGQRGGKADNGERFQRDFTEEQDAICMVSNS